MAPVKEIAYKRSLKTSKIADLIEKSGDEKSIFATQRCRKRLKHVPIDPDIYINDQKEILDLQKWYKSCLKTIHMLNVGLRPLP